jgi:ATP-dependent exoDNAse (exonuclease V) alpha subunit
MEFEGHPAEYEWSETDELTLACAVSVHKAQGAEFPVIVMPGHDAAKKLALRCGDARGIYAC